MRRAAVGQIVGGSIGLGTSIAGLIVPSPMERLRNSGAYHVVEQNPDDPDALARLHREWALAAHKARRSRLTFGGLNILGGGIAVTVASVRLFPSADRRSSENLWAYTTLSSGLSLVAAGLYSILLPSELERSYDSHAAGRGRPTSKRLRKRARQARVQPTVGGMVISGRF